MNLTQKYLKSILNYDPETGIFTWLVRKSINIKKIGQVAGCLNKDLGYWFIQIDGKLERAHRLAFLYMTGKLPLLDIDHINGLRCDNRWINLREATDSQNQGNRKLNRNSKSGYKGVEFKQNRLGS